jgi:hypothetical protein
MATTERTSEAKIISELVVPGGNRRGFVFEVENRTAKISNQFITSMKQFSAVIERYPDYQKYLHEMYGVIIAGEGIAGGVLNAGGGQLTVTEDSSILPVRGAGAPVFKHSLAIAVGCNISDKELKGNKILYSLLNTQILGKQEIVFAARSEREGKAEYLFIVPRINGLSPEDQIVYETAMGNGTLFATKFGLKPEQCTLHFADIKGFCVGKFENGFTVVEEIGGKTITKDGLLLGPELQKGGNHYNMDLMVPTLMPKDFEIEILGTKFKLKTEMLTVIDTEIIAGSTDSFGIGTGFDTKGGNSPLGRLVLQVYNDGRARAYSGGRVVAEGKLIDLLNKNYPAGEEGRTEGVSVAKAYVDRLTDDWLTGQLRSLVRSSKINNMIFDEGKVLSLNPLKNVLRDVDEQLQWRRGKN